MIIWHFSVFKLETLTYLTNLEIRVSKRVRKTIHTAEKERRGTCNMAKEIREFRIKCVIAHTKGHCLPTKGQH